MLRRMGTLGTALTALVVSALVFLPGVAPAQAEDQPQTHTWTGVESGSWTNPKNWDTNKTPKMFDSIIVNPGQYPIVDAPVITLGSLTVNTGGSISGDALSGIVAANVTLGGGTIGVDVTAQLLLTIGSNEEDPTVVTGEGVTLQSELKTFMAGGSVIKTFFDADVVNNGTWSVVANPLGSWATVNVNRCCTGPSKFVNNGTIDGDGSLLVTNGAFTMRPGSTITTDVEVRDGVPAIGGRVSVNGTDTTLHLRGGARLLRIPGSADPVLNLGNGAEFMQSDSAEIAAPVTFAKGGTGNPTYEWNGGSITGGITVDENVRMNVRTAAPRSYSPPRAATAFTNKGTIRFHDSTPIMLRGRIVNDGTITVLAGADPVLTGYSCCTSPIPGQVVNNKTIDASADGASFTAGNVAFKSLGDGSVLKGKVAIDGGVNWLGRGLELQGASTRVVQGDGGMVVGDGRVTIADGARLTVNERSTIRGTDTFRIGGAGRFVWGSGYFEGYLTVGSDATFEISDPVGEIDPFRRIDTLDHDSVLVAEGTTIQRGDVLLWGSTHDAIVRMAGTWKLFSGGMVDNGASLVRIVGDVVVDPGDGTTVGLAADRVFTEGTVDVRSGTLDIDAQIRFNHTKGRVTVGAGTVLRSATPYVLAANGVLTGQGTIDASVANSGEVRPGPGRSTLRVLGDYRQGPDATLSVEVSATSAGRLRVGGTATLDGTVRVIGSRLPASGTAFDIVTAARRVDTFDVLTGPVAGGLRFGYTPTTARIVAR